MMTMLSNDVLKHFGFLVNEFGFVKLPEYHYVREIHNEFAGGGMIVKLTYDGGFWLNILVPKFDISPILNGEKRTVDYDNSLFKVYDLGNLDLDKKIYNAVSIENFSEKELWYYARLLRENPEILKGDLRKLKWKFWLLKKLRLR